MRVIAGAFRGRRLRAPRWAGLRPTSDKLRETLFNILGPSVRDARMLDGYAGTGAVGIEALSRGAEHVTFVEQDARAVRLIESNLQLCGLAAPVRTSPHLSAPLRTPPHPSAPYERYAIIRAWFAGAETRLGEAAFDVIFLDPPYGATELIDALRSAEALVGDATLLVIEHAKRDGAPERAGPLARTRAVTSGDSALAFYRRAPGADGPQ